MLLLENTLKWWPHRFAALNCRCTAKQRCRMNTFLYTKFRDIHFFSLFFFVFRIRFVARSLVHPHTHTHTIIFSLRWGWSVVVAVVVGRIMPSIQLPFVCVCVYEPKVICTRSITTFSYSLLTYPVRLGRQSFAPTSQNQA